MSLFGQPRLVLPGDIVMTQARQGFACESSGSTQQTLAEDTEILIAFVEQVRDLRAAQKRYFAAHVPTAARRDLLVAARELEAAVDKATAAILATYGAQ
jgi:hypothetical protein